MSLRPACSPLSISLRQVDSAHSAASGCTSATGREMGTTAPLCLLVASLLCHLVALVFFRTSKAAVHTCSYELHTSTLSALLSASAADRPKKDSEAETRHDSARRSSRKQRIISSHTLLITETYLPCSSSPSWWIDCGYAWNRDSWSRSFWLFFLFVCVQWFRSVCLSV